MNSHNQEAQSLAPDEYRAQFLSNRVAALTLELANSETNARTAIGELRSQVAMLQTQLRQQEGVLDTAGARIEELEVQLAEATAEDENDNDMHPDDPDNPNNEKVDVAETPDAIPDLLDHTEFDQHR